MIGSALHHAVMLSGGWALFGLGVIGAPLPLHPGVPLLALGGLMLVGRSRSFRRLVAHLRRQVPGYSAVLTVRSRTWPRALRYLIVRTDPRRVLGPASVSITAVS